jgi:hypothetical protein
MTLTHRTSLYEACQQLSPIHPDYATLPIQEGFNWSSCLGDVYFDRLYLLVFRSVLRVSADLELLWKHDKRAHAEALAAGGLLCYFRGVMNERRECLSFCLWESREQARRGSAGASHRTASGIVAQTYEAHSLERYYLIKVGEAKERLEFRSLEEGVSHQGIGALGQPT